MYSIYVLLSAIEYRIFFKLITYLIENLNKISAQLFLSYTLKTLSQYIFMKFFLFSINLIKTFLIKNECINWGICINKDEKKFRELKKILL